MTGQKGSQFRVFGLANHAGDEASPEAVKPHPLDATRAALFKEGRKAMDRLNEILDSVDDPADVP